MKLAKTICHRDIYWFVLMAGHAQMAIFKGLNIKLLSNQYQTLQENGIGYAVSECYFKSFIHQTCFVLRASAIRLFELLSTTLLHDKTQQK